MAITRTKKGYKYHIYAKGQMWYCINKFDNNYLFLNTGFVILFFISCVCKTQAGSLSVFTQMYSPLFWNEYPLGQTGNTRSPAASKIQSFLDVVCGIVWVTFSVQMVHLTSLITQGTVCWGMLQGLGSDVIKPSCSVCFCKVKTNTSMSIWTQLWYFYLPHQLQAAIIISNLMKLVQHLASSCLFDSEQMEGHLVWAEQTGSSWGGVCIPTFLQRFKAAFLHPPPTSSVPVMTLDQTQGILWIQQS